jgi:hypothetical protein
MTIGGDDEIFFIKGLIYITFRKTPQAKEDNVAKRTLGYRTGLKSRVHLDSLGIALLGLFWAVCVHII